MIDVDLYKAKKLYPFQEETVNTILSELDSNGKDFNLLYQLPTGGGKTVIFSEIGKKYIEKWKKKVLICCCSSLCGCSGYFGRAYPWDCSSAMASLSCGNEALMFGNFITLASGVLTRFPRVLSASSTGPLLEICSGKADSILAASDMFLVSMDMP